MRLLIAQDDPRISYLLERLAHSWGYAPRTVAQREDFWSVALANRGEHIIILDAALAGSEILGMCRAIRQGAADDRAYLLVLTSRSEWAWRQRLLRAGADDTITKPFEPDDLRARLSVASRVVRLGASVRFPLGLPATLGPGL
jgi:DNA-binding response OmpR family regulator